MLKKRNRLESLANSKNSIFCQSGNLHLNLAAILKKYTIEVPCYSAVPVGPLITEIGAGRTYSSYRRYRKAAHHCEQ